jgi:predicted PurR-regulated permease PerM
MVGKVLIAGILAIIIASYLRPLYMLLLRRLKRPMLSAVLTLLVVIIPVLGALVYSYTELVDVLGYISTHQSEVAGQIDASIRRLPYLGTVNATENIRRYVLFVSDYGTKVPAAIKRRSSSCRSRRRSSCSRQRMCLRMRTRSSVMWRARFRSATTGCGSRW